MIVTVSVETTTSGSDVFNNSMNISLASNAVSSIMETFAHLVVLSADPDVNVRLEEILK